MDNNPNNESDIVSEVKSSLEEELAEIINQISKQMPNLVDQIKFYQQYFTNIDICITEVAVREDLIDV